MVHSSGIGTCIRELVPYFKQSHFQIILLVNKINEPWCRGIEQIAFPYPIYSIREQFAYSWKIPKCDLFWSPHYNSPIMAIRAKKKVVTIHDACHLALSHLLSPVEKIYSKIMMRWAVHHSDAVITSSNFSKGELIRFLKAPKNELRVIPCGINHSRFQKTKDIQVKKNTQEKYHLPPRFFLFVGNHKTHKNLSGLITAFHRASLANVSLVMVGKSVGLKNSVSVFGDRIHALGDLPDADLPVLYNLAEALILPSFYEGFGFPPLEAMSCGCPTIVSNAASLPEVCGKASLYVNPSNPDELAQAMIKVAHNTNLKELLIENGQKWAREFDWGNTAEAYLNTFNQVLSNA